MQKYTSYISTHFREFVLAPADRFTKLALANVPLHLGNGLPRHPAHDLHSHTEILRNVTYIGYARQIRWCLKVGFIPATEQLELAAEQGHFKAFKILCAESHRMVTRSAPLMRSVYYYHILYAIIRAGNTEMYDHLSGAPKFAPALITDDLKYVIAHTPNPLMVDRIAARFGLHSFAEAFTRYASAYVFARFVQIAKIDWSDSIQLRVVENPDLETVRMVLDIIAKPSIRDGTPKLMTHISTHLGKLHHRPERDAELIEILREYNVYDHESYIAMHESDIYNEDSDVADADDD